MYDKNDLIMLDCDGVIFDSNHLKSNAFKHVLEYKKYPQKLINDFVIYHKKNGGISRYQKFKVFIIEFLKQDFNQDLYLELLTLYGDICISLYKNANLTEGAIKFLNSNKSVKYIVSGGKEEELIQVFQDREIKNYFARICGSPRSKNEIIQEILSNYNKKSFKNIIFIGDSKEDLEVSVNNNLQTIFMCKYSENKEELLTLCKSKNIRIINTLEELL